MKCAICDQTLSPTEVQWNSLHEDWDPCSTCQLIISEVFEDPLDEDEITRLLDEEEADEIPNEDNDLHDFT